METCQRRPCVLLVDDDNMVLRLFQDYLTAEGFVVVGVTSAQAALEILIRGEGRVDLVVTDIMMARMDGWEFLHMIRKKLKLDGLVLPVIVMTAFVCDTLEVKALQYGANGIYIKGTPIQKLIHEAKIQTGLVRSKYSDA
jgi:CheY-like chemotaxis protein